MVGGKCLTERAVLSLKSPRMRQHRRDVIAAVDPMDEASEHTLELSLGRRPDTLCGLRSKPLEYAIDALPRGERVSKGEARRDETDDFTVFDALVSMDDVDRISAAARDGVGALE